MLVIQRPTVEAARRGRRQPSAVRRQPARARLRPHARQLAAPHAAVVDPRRGHHAGPLRRRPARVRHHRRRHRGRHRHHPQPQGPRAHVARPTSRSRCASTCAARPRSPPATSSRTSDVEILNPDLHIATLNGKGRLAIDLTVERGRGYLSADRDKQPRHHRRDPGRLDLLAGPPGDVHGRAHPRRAVDRTTTASSSTSRPTAPSRPARPWPRPAPRCARWSQLVAEMSDEPQGLELGEVGRRRPPARPTSTSRSRTSTCPSVPATASSGPRSTPSASCCSKTEDDLLAITNFGQKSLDEVIAEARRARPVAPRDRGLSDSHACHPEARAAASAATPRTSG